ncbi:complement C4-B isoform X2 [Brienomyrus brachyistius]|uniref:complement C4-B isoform X2 n=1 Tax=Brienomyrus brachyistius TaxID=42636 RepID=UPI0020B28559|nr:complement C4-B isoform X2 [Brienomyrus brachyistius]
MELSGLLLMSVSFAVMSVSAQDMFLVTAPSVFHLGVRERVSVQLQSDLNQPVSLYLEHETSGTLMSNKASFQMAEQGETGLVELEVDKGKLSLLPKESPPYLMLVCEIRPGQREMVRVLVSEHRGYIFIQTDQPVYSPTQSVNYRIFTLDHAMKPYGEFISFAVFNAGGNKVTSGMVRTKDGTITRKLNIPDVSEPGTWRIMAHYLGDEKNAATREFRVQKFVMPSFDVSIVPEESYFLETLKEFNFTIYASYSYGKQVKGAYHCRFGVREEAAKEADKPSTAFIRGLQRTGSLEDGKAEVGILTSQLKHLLAERGANLTQLASDKVQLHIAVSVTDTASGELQEAELFLPMASRRFSVDLSRTRSHFIPGVPLRVSVLVRLPNGSPAADIPVRIDVPRSSDLTRSGFTDHEGALHSTFNNIPVGDQPVTITVTVDDGVHEKIVYPSMSQSKHYLYMDVSPGIVSLRESVSVDFTVVGGKPRDGRIHYLVLSKGVLRGNKSLETESVARSSILVSGDLIPSFRVIGYYYNQAGDIIADSLWVDVKDVCEGKISLTSKSQYTPGSKANLDINLEGQKATVALLAVDKAIYALNAQNKLTAKQVFASMQSYDLGCSYGGGRDTADVFNDAGLSFISHSKEATSRMRKGFGCESGFRRQKRSLDLQQFMMSKVLSYESVELQRCCQDGFTLIPMKRTCEERVGRVSQTGAGAACATAFLECCREGMAQRKLMRAQRTHGRTFDVAHMEDFFDTSVTTIRRFFPPSFAFDEFQVDGSRRHVLVLPDSITTWEIQAISLSSSHGICVSDPHELLTFKELFVSLRLPYSVRQYEQLAVAAVVYNYGDKERKLSIHMKPVDGLCSPGSASTLSYLNVTVSSGTSQTVTFPAVPMVNGKIPITLSVFDKEEEMVLDTIEKELLVMTEGVQKRDEKTYFINFDGRARQHFQIDGLFPNSTIPESPTNIFARIEGEVFGQSTALPLLSPAGVQALLTAPMGCAEQTMIRMSPTALALRYLDHTQGWVELPPGSRDVALGHVENGYSRILTFRKSDGSYGAWTNHPSSYWLTALVVKVMSLVVDRQLEGRGQKERVEVGVSQDEIQKSVEYLIAKQGENGSFTDPNPVIHREMQGGVGGVEGDVSLTAFITIALNHSLRHLTGSTKKNTEDSISRSTAFIQSRFSSLERPYAAAIAAYCLSVCGNDPQAASFAWKNLQALATAEEECRVWRSKSDTRLQNELRHYLVPPSEAITVETTGYALLAALANKDLEWADSAACWLSKQENYGGGFRSTQDTIVALEALSELAISRPPQPPPKMDAKFSVPGRSQTEKLALEKKGDRVQVELKRLLGATINAELTGNGKAKLKVVKAYHVLEPVESCELLSIKVTVEGKVQYTADVMYNYDYEEYSDVDDGNRHRRDVDRQDEDRRDVDRRDVDRRDVDRQDEDRQDEDRQDEDRQDEDIPRSEIDWFDARSRRRRDTEQSDQNTVVYSVCVSHPPSRNLSGMAVADITLLSGFQAQREDLDKLKDLTDRYISHYEIEDSRVLLYFNELPEGSTCIAFDATQTVAVGLVQPAPAVFYDYYEPDRRCTTFYAAPSRSRMVSTLCSGDVCQCAEKPCYKEKKTFEMKIRKRTRFDFACFSPTVDYSYKVKVTSISEKGNFELYEMRVNDVLRSNGDIGVRADSVRVFAKRRHCKGQLELDQIYLIMGQDGSTKDTSGEMQYLLDSSTWVEKLPLESKCKTTNKILCNDLKDFSKEYLDNGCTQ